MKKVLSLALSICLLLNCCVFALAEETSSIPADLSVFYYADFNSNETTHVPGGSRVVYTNGGTVTQENNGLHCQVASGVSSNSYIDIRSNPVNNSGYYETTETTDYYIIDATIIPVQVGANTSIGLFDAKDSNGKWRKGLDISMKPNHTIAITGASNVTWTENTPVRISIACDMVNSKADVYVNGSIVSGNLSFTSYPRSFNFRIDITSSASGEGLDFYIDDVMIYGGTTLLNKDYVRSFTHDSIMDNPVTAIKSLGDAMAFTVESDYYHTNGSKKTYSSDAQVPVFYGNEAYVSEEFISGVLPANNISVSSNPKAVTINGSQYIPASEVAELLNKEYLFDNRGYFILSDEVFPYATTNHFKDLFDKDDIIFRYLYYANPTGEQMVADFNANATNIQRPRILFTNDDITYIKSKLAANDPDYVKAYETYANGGASGSVLRVADSFCNTAFNNTSQYFSFISEETLSTMSTSSRNSKRHSNTTIFMSAMENLALAYYISGDSKYAARAVEIMDLLTDWDTLNLSYSNLSAGHWARGLAVGYDSFYNYILSTENGAQKLADYRAAAISLALNDVIKGYKGTSTNVKWPTIADNFVGVCSGGMMTLAMAMGTELQNEFDDYEYMIENIIKSMQIAFALYHSNGGYYEGMGYASYMFDKMETTLEAMFRCFGTDYGLTNTRGLDEMGNLFLYMQTKNNMFNYHDASSGSSTVSFPTWFAYRRGKVAAAKMLIQEGALRGDTFPLLHTMYYDKAVELYGDPDVSNYPLDRFFDTIDTGTFRNTFNSSSPVFAGFHGGWTTLSHGMLDVGQFIFESDGVVWAHDLGGELSYPSSYFSTSGYKYYRKRPEGENCIVINPEDDITVNADGSQTINYYGQEFDTTSELIAYDTSDNAAMAVLDLSDVYGRDVSSYKRGYYFGDNRNTYLIQDEITLTKENSEIYWFMHTPATITIQDNQTALLEYNGKQLRAEVYCNVPGYELISMAAAPLPSSPTPPASNSVNSSTKLTVHCENANDDVVIAVKLIPVRDNYSPTPLSVEPISDWIIENRGNLTVFTNTHATHGDLINFNDHNYAVENSKVMFTYTNEYIPSWAVAGEDYTIEYLNNGTPVIASEGIIEGTVALPINSGENSFVAIATYGLEKYVSEPVTIYGSELTDGTVNTSSLAGVHTNVTSTVTGIANGTTSSETLTADTAKAILGWDEENNVATRTVYQPKGTGTSNTAVGFYTAADGTSDTKFDLMEVSFDVFFTTSDTGTDIGLVGNYPYALGGTYVSAISRHTAFNVRNDGNLSFYHSSSGYDNARDTGFDFEPGRWYNVKYYYDTVTDKIDVYVDGVLLTKDSYNNIMDKTATAGYGFEDYRFRLLGAYSSNADTNSTFYISNPTINTATKHASRAALSITADDYADTVTVTATDITDENVYLFINDVPQSAPLTFENGIAVINDVSDDVTVYAKAIDENGNTLKNVLGEDIITETVSMQLIEGDYTVGGVELSVFGNNHAAHGNLINFADHNFAVSGSKVMFTLTSEHITDTATEGTDYTVVYYNNGTIVTASEGIIEDTVALPVNEGENSYVAMITVDNNSYASEPVTIYGSELTDGTVNTSSLAGVHTNVTSTVTGIANGTTSSETLTADTAKAILGWDEVNNVATRTVYQPKGTGTSNTAVGFYTAADGTSDTKFDLMEVSFDVFFTTSDTGTDIGLVGNYPYALGGTYVSAISRHTAFNVRNDGNLSFYHSSSSYDNARDTGFDFEPGRWYNVKYYYDAITDKIDVYVDGILLTKDSYNNIMDKTATAGYGFEDYRFRLLGAYSSNADTNSTFYISNPAVNTSIEHSVRGKIEISADDYADTVTVTGTDITTENIYLFVNDVQQGEPLVFENGVATVGNIIGDVSVYAKAVEEDGTDGANRLGEMLVTDTIQMNIDVCEGGVEFTTFSPNHSTHGDLINFADHNFAIKDSKVMFEYSSEHLDENAVEGVDYTIEFFNNDTSVTPSDGLIDGTVALPINSGENSFVAVLTTAGKSYISDSVVIYGSELTDGTVDTSSLASVHTNATSAVTSIANGTTSSETLTAETAKSILGWDETTNTATRTVYQPKGTSTSGTAVGLFTAADGTSDTKFDLLEVSFDVFFTTSAIGADIGLVGNYPYALGGSYIGSISRNTAFNVRNDGNLSFYHSSTGYANARDTGFDFETGRWYNVKYYYDAITDKIDVYVDGILLTKDSYNNIMDKTATAGYGFEDYRFRLLGAYSSNADTNSTFYISNPVINSSLQHSNLEQLGVSSSEITETITATETTQEYDVQDILEANVENGSEANVENSSEANDENVSYDENDATINEEPLENEVSNINDENYDVPMVVSPVEVPGNVPEHSIEVIQTE